jgi:tetratricopeptide (TPR) repeat protein
VISDLGFRIAEFNEQLENHLPKSKIRNPQLKPCCKLPMTLACLMSVRAMRRINNHLRMERDTSSDSTQRRIQMKPRPAYKIILALVALSGASIAQQVVYYADSTQALNKRWAWAMEQAGQSRFNNGYWVGYSISRLMEENSTIGSVSIKNDRVYRMPGKSLSELIYGNPVPMELNFPKTKSPQKVLKEVGFFFYIAPRDRSVIKVEQSTFSLSVNFKGMPLLWLGRTANEPSLDLVEQLYRKALSSDLKDELMCVVSMHDNVARRRTFLSGILSSDEGNKLRKQAAFWLGQNDDDAEAMRLLEKTALNDRSAEVRKQAVFAISEMNTTTAENTLIELAQNREDTEIRKEAIFWLAQKASKRAIATLKEALEDDEDAEVRKHAVFALTQLENDEGIPILIDIAKNHRNRAVRKEAIFWLGQSDDPRAVSTLVKIVREQ